MWSRVKVIRVLFLFKGNFPNHNTIMEQKDKNVYMYTYTVLDITVKNISVT